MGENGVQTRLLRDKDLDLNKAVETCKSSEAASVQPKRTHKFEEVKKFDQKRKCRQQVSQRKQGTIAGRTTKSEARKEEN